MAAAHAVRQMRMSPIGCPAPGGTYPKHAGQPDARSCDPCPARARSDVLVGLARSGPNVDELALELDDGVRLAPQFVAHDWLAPAALEQLESLDALLGAMSGPENASLWDHAALESSLCWAEVREQAKLVLHLIP